MFYKLLPFRHTKQTCKNVTGTTLNELTKRICDLSFNTDLLIELENSELVPDKLLENHRTCSNSTVLKRILPKVNSNIIYHNTGLQSWSEAIAKINVGFT